MEVLYDLDEEARQLCDELGPDDGPVAGPSARTRGSCAMLRELIDERVARPRPTSAAPSASSARATTSARSIAACPRPGRRPPAQA